VNLARKQGPKNVRDEELLGEKQTNSSGVVERNEGKVPEQKPFFLEEGVLLLYLSGEKVLKWKTLECVIREKEAKGARPFSRDLGGQEEKRVRGKMGLTEAPYERVGRAKSTRVILEASWGKKGRDDLGTKKKPDPSGIRVLQ